MWSPTIKDPLTEGADQSDCDDESNDSLNIATMDPRILDAGLFCQPVGSFSPLVANKATTQTMPQALNSVEMATTTLKNAGLGYHSFILTFDSGASRMSTGNKSDFTALKDTGFDNLELDGIASGLKIQGIGIVQYNVTMDDGTRVTLKLKAL